MKKLLSSLVLFSSLIVIGFTSCKKENNSPAPKTKTELLTQSSWKFSSAKAGTTDITSNIDACYKDNITTFNSTGGTGNVNESTIVCTPSSAVNFTWAFQNNETELNISANIFPGGSGVITIISLTETTMVLAQDMTIPPYPTTNVQVTMTH